MSRIEKIVARCNRSIFLNHNKIISKTTFAENCSYPQLTCQGQALIAMATKTRKLVSKLTQLETHLTGYEELKNFSKIRVFLISICYVPRFNHHKMWCDNGRLNCDGIYYLT